MHTHFYTSMPTDQNTHLADRLTLLEGSTTPCWLCVHILHTLDHQEVGLEGQILVQETQPLLCKFQPMVIAVNLDVNSPAEGVIWRIMNKVFHVSYV